jgi:hypothetical protein
MTDKTKFSAILGLLSLVLISLPKTSAAQTSPVLLKPTPAPASPASISDGGIRTPFSKEEETFYQRAWPIRKSHSAQALLLIGGVFLILLFLLGRKMFNSPPRKPPKP